jgi:23S rRNA pseudouridine1911/1915/1917 synthase
MRPRNVPSGKHDDAGGETVRIGGDLVLKGGKVDPEAIRRAVEEARAKQERGPDGGDGTDATDAGDDESLRRVVFEIKHDLDKRLDKYLTDRISFMSRTQLQKLIDGGGVLVNDKLPRSSTKIHAGDVVEVVVPEPPAKNIQPEDIPLDVLFEDEHLIVLNKRPDIIVHPARSHLKGTLLSALAYHFKYRSKVGGALSTVGDELARPGVVHRLDRYTSGCIVFAKTEEAHWKIAHQFEHRRVDKRYLAVVHGKIQPPTDVIELPLGPHPSREKGYREKYVVRHDALGKPSTTIYRVREWFETKDGPFTLVELELKTGRTHQIRVHLSHQGWPIVGDSMYGGKAIGLPSIHSPVRDVALRDREGPASKPRKRAAKPATDNTSTPLHIWNAEVMGLDVKIPDGIEPIIIRQALHAALLSITHPITGEPMTFTAPPRGDFDALLATLRERSSGGEKLDAPGAIVRIE